MNNLLEQLDRLEQLVESITATAPTVAGGTLAAEASKRVFKTIERLEAQRLGWVGEVESEGLWGLDTMRSFAHWLGWRDGLGVMTAKRQVHQARTLRDFLPETARSAREGNINMEHVRLMVQVAATSDARRATLAAPVPEDPLHEGSSHEGPLHGGPLPEESQGEVADDSSRVGTGQGRTGQGRTGEQVLVDMAQNVPLRDFRRVARRFAQVADPEADDRGFRTASEREHVTLAQTFDGYHLQGFLSVEHGQLLQRALRAVQGVPQAGESLTREQRLATALGGMAKLVLDNGLAGTGSSVRPHLSVLVSWSEFLGLAGATGANIDPVTGSPVNLAELVSQPSTHWEDGTGPIPRAVLNRIAADCNITRIVFGPAGQILNVGRAQRTLTGAKRRAIIARDKNCVWMGCHAPPQISEIHHAERHWADGGETSTDNAALLCWFHHRHVDARKIVMRWNDGWEFDDPRTYPLPWYREEGHEVGWSTKEPSGETTTTVPTGSWSGSRPGEQKGTGHDPPRSKSGSKDDAA